MRIRLGSEYLDLFPGTAITITVHNPFFDNEGAEALYSFPFDIPATPKNLTLLGYPNRLDHMNNTALFPAAVLEVDGVPFEHGVLELDAQKFTPDRIGVVFRNTAPDVWDALSKIRIRDVMETVSSQASPPAPYWTYNLSVTPATGIEYKIIIDTIAFAWTAPSNVPVQAVVSALSLAIEAEFPGLAVQGNNQTALRLNSDQVNLHYIDHDLLQNLEFTGAVTVGQSIHRGLLNHANIVNAASSASHRFPVVFWKEFYKRAVTDYLERINPILNEETIENQPEDNDRTWTTAFVPFVTVPYIFQRIIAAAQNYFTTHTGWFADNQDAQDLIIFNNRSLDAVIRERHPLPGLPFKYFNGHKSSIRLADHLPDLDAKTFLQNLMTQFALWVRITGTSLHFTKKQEQTTGTPINWTHLSDPGFQATRIFRRGFTLQYPNIEDEDRVMISPDYPNQLEDYIDGEGFHQITLPAATAKIGEAIGIRAQQNDPVGVMPVVSQPGTSDEAGLGKNDYSFRLLFYRGLQGASNNVTYPMASHGAEKYGGASVGNLSLDLSPAGGLYQLHHQGVLDLILEGTPITLPVRLGVHDILEVRKWTNPRRTITLHEGHVTALVKSIQFRASADGIGVSIVELVQEKGKDFV